MFHNETAFSSVKPLLLLIEEVNVLMQALKYFVLKEYVVR